MSYLDYKWGKRMKVQLLCSDNVRIVVEELLTNRNMEIDNTSDYCIVEKRVNYT